MLDVYASQPHYFDHLAPIFNALPTELQGDVLFENRHLAGHPLVKQYAGTRYARPKAKRVLVAGGGDVLKMARHGYGIALLEHGAGQAYCDDPEHPSYAGGTRRDTVGLFLCTNNDVALRNDARYGRRSAVVGSPRLDHLAKLRAERELNDGPTLVITWHWPCKVSVEAWWAFPEFQASLVAVRNQWPGKVIGTCHPKGAKLAEPVYRSAGIEWVADWAQAVTRADVVSFDNTSAGFEAAALGVPVVMCESLAWRRRVEHGLRFWRWADLGPVVRPRGNADEIAEAWLIAAHRALLGENRARCRVMADEVYPHRGNAATLAVAALTRWLGA